MNIAEVTSLDAAGSFELPEPDRASSAVGDAMVASQKSRYAIIGDVSEDSASVLMQQALGSLGKAGGGASGIGGKLMPVGGGLITTGAAGVSAKRAPKIYGPESKQDAALLGYKQALRYAPEGSMIGLNEADMTLNKEFMDRYNN